jgi:hypothetical protein
MPAFHGQLEVDSYDATDASESETRLAIKALERIPASIDQVRRMLERSLPSLQTAGLSEVLGCRGRIRGGWDRGQDDRGSYGIFLDVALYGSHPREP